MENSHGPSQGPGPRKGQGHRKWPKTLFGAQSMDKYFHCLIQMKGIESIGIET